MNRLSINERFNFERDIQKELNRVGLGFEVASDYIYVYVNDWSVVTICASVEDWYTEHIPAEALLEVLRSIEGKIELEDFWKLI